MKEITRCAIYTRVSTTGQRDQHTIKSQHEVLSSYADSQGWDTVETYVDDGKSGESIEGRPAFERLLQDAIEDRFDVVLVVDLDRLTRSSQSAEGGLIYDILSKYKVKIATPTHLIDLENDEQGLLAGISREFSKYEKLKIRVRTQRGKLSKLREGKLADGSVPFGYQRVPDPSNPKRARTRVVVDDREAELYRRIVRMIRVEGLSLNKLCHHLNEEGLRTRRGRRWSSSGLSRILRNTAHKGELRCRRYAHRFEMLPSKRRPGAKVRRRFVTERPSTDHITIRVDHIISPEEWEEVQTRINAARNNNLHYLGRGDREGPVDDPYLLRGLAYCGLCRSKLQMRAGSAPGSRYYYCHWSVPCAQRRSGGTKACALPWIPAEVAEWYPMSTLTHALLMPEEIVQRYAALLSGDGYLKDLRDRLGAVTREEKILKDQELLLLEKALSSGFSEEAIAEKAKDLRSRLSWLVEQRSTLESDLKRAEEKAQTVTWMQERSESLRWRRRDLREWWEETSTRFQRHRLLRTLIDPERGGRIYIDPPPGGYVPDPTLDLGLWGGKVRCQFKFDPHRLVEALEGMEVTGRSTAKPGKVKRVESRKVGPEDFG